jgi:hypothetical protein
VANRDGLTALDWAQQYQHEDTVRVLFASHHPNPG